jgi:hypothetical protein
MSPKLPFEVIIEIIHQLDYSCYPKILHVNRAIREWVLDNWLTIRKARSQNWKDNIPMNIASNTNLRLMLAME